MTNVKVQKNPKPKHVMPDLMRHSDVIPTKALHRMVYRAKVGLQVKYWIPASAGMTPF